MNLNISKNYKFWLAVAVQAAVILGIIIFKYSILAGGTTVLLKIAPVDPRDPLRGDYVTFQYEINTINGYEFNYNNFPQNGDTIYVGLVPRGKFWQINDVLTSAPDKTTDYNRSTVYLKAVVERGGLAKGEDLDTKNLYNRTVTVKYGLEEMFIPEGAGRNFNFWNKEAYAVVKVDEKGNGVLKNIYIDNEKWP